MVRPPSIDSNGMKKGAWSEEEDNKLRAYVLRYGHWNWRLLPKYAGLARCGKSCRLRWVNYLKPGVRRGKFTKEEEDLVTKLHSQLGNKWSVIASKLPGRTDNEVKNFYHTRIEKKKTRGHATNVLERDDSLESVLERESYLESTQESTLTSSRLDTYNDTTSLDQIEDDLWSDLFQPSDASNDRFPPLMEEGFFYPDLHYSELSCSDDHSIISSEFADPSYFWDESSSSYQNGERSSCDPLFDHRFDYGIFQQLKNILK